MDYDIERWMDATDDADDEEMMEPSPYVQDVFESRVGTVELLDAPVQPSAVQDVSGQASASGRGYQVLKEVRDGKLVSMQAARI